MVGRGYAALEVRTNNARRIVGCNVYMAAASESVSRKPGATPTLSKPAAIARPLSGRRAQAADLCGCFTLRGSREVRAREGEALLCPPLRVAVAHAVAGGEVTGDERAW